MKTFSPKATEIERKWYLVDAKKQVLGRLATKIAVVLRGKNKPIFAPHVDCGDYVVVINAEKVKLTGNKLTDKLYYRHSRWPGALKSENVAKVLAEKPEKVLERAVTGMIPRNRLRKDVLSKLKIFAGEEHSHTAQNPEPLKL